LRVPPEVNPLAVLLLVLALWNFPSAFDVHAIGAPPAQTIGTQWVPAVPTVDKLLFQVYSDSTAEFNAFQTGQVDIVDARVPDSLVSSFQADSRYLLTDPVSQYDIAGIEFNMTNTFWGIPFNHGNDPRGVQLRQGIAHLISKNGFIEQQLGGAAFKTDCFAPSLQLTSPIGVGSLKCPKPTDAPIPANGNIPSWSVCSWEQAFIVAHPENATCQGAYSFGSNWDSTGAVLVGSPDFCAAADHFIAAGLATGKNPPTATSNPCVLKGLASSAQTQTIDLWVPSIESGRMIKYLGNALASSINRLMGRTAAPQAVTVCDWSNPGWSDKIDINERKDIWYSLNEQWLAAIGARLTPCHSSWHMTVQGWVLSQNIDQAYWVYNSRFSFNGYSNQTFDRWSSMTEFNDTSNSNYVLSAESAEYILGKDAITIPVWSSDGRFVYLNGWNNVVNQQGKGPPNAWTAQNARNPRPPVNGTIRWGFEESTQRLNPFTSLTYWDWFILSEIYDSLLASNPYSPLDSFGWMANSWAFQSPQPTDYPGTAVDIKFQLKNNMRFHDGKPVTASDVKFSLLSLTMASGVSTIDVLNVHIDNDYSFTVNLGHNSPYELSNVGSIPILPQHVWASDGATPCVSAGTPQCSVNLDLITGNPSDLVSSHKLIGSGPFLCRDLFNTTWIGGGCTSTGSSTVDLGGVVVLERLGLGISDASPDAYYRDSAKYKTFQWADFTQIGQVTPADKSILSACLNKPDSTPIPGTTQTCAYWDTPAAAVTCPTPQAGSCFRIGGALVIPGGNSGGTTTTTDLNQLATYLNQYWTYPIAYGILVGSQPFPQTLYEGGVTYAPCTQTPPQC
jgi:ABC-type transport system substrate-binding protein